MKCNENFVASKNTLTIELILITSFPNKPFLRRINITQKKIRAIINCFSGIDFHKKYTIDDFALLGEASKILIRVCERKSRMIDRVYQLRKTMRKIENSVVEYHAFSNYFRKWCFYDNSLRENQNKRTSHSVIRNRYSSRANIPNNPWKCPAPFW